MALVEYSCGFYVIGLNFELSVKLVQVPQLLYCILNRYVFRHQCYSITQF